MKNYRFRIGNNSDSFYFLTISEAILGAIKVSDKLKIHLPSHDILKEEERGVTKILSDGNG